MDRASLLGEGLHEHVLRGELTEEVHVHVDAPELVALGDHPREVLLLAVLEVKVGQLKEGLEGFQIFDHPRGHLRIALLGHRGEEILHVRVDSLLPLLLLQASLALFAHRGACLFVNDELKV